MSNSSRNGHLTKKQKSELMDKVQAERERIFNKLNLEQPHKIVQEAESGKDEVDSANDDILRRTELRFATRESLYLKKLVKTLELMETDDYGTCEDCGQNISFTRLKARPTSTMCIGCKEESERDEMQNYHGRISKSLGKSVSFR
ncbi:MAG: TraR/DksA family transcriptional regulator [Bacteriovoracaceae bacterium]|jgi:DnaK suppressor protein|nr:TraR/DksA family transcriptional regulator [Bacteriovoracaceae bacterium]